MPISTIKPRDVLAALRKIEARGAIESAHKIKQTCGQVFRYDSGTLVQWIDIQGTPFRKHGAHLAILFDGSDKMVRVTHKFDTN